MMTLTCPGHSLPHTTSSPHNTSRKRSRERSREGSKDRRHEQNSKQDHSHCQKDNEEVQPHHSGRGGKRDKEQTRYWLRSRGSPGV